MLDPPIDLWELTLSVRELDRLLAWLADPLTSTEQPRLGRLTTRQRLLVADGLANLSDA